MQELLVVEVIPREKGRTSIRFDNGMEVLLYKGEVRKLSLREGTVISREKYDEIIYEILGTRAKKRAMFLLERMDRTEHQLREKLMQNGYPDVCVDLAVEYVRKYHYIDDLRYATTYISYQQKKKSRHILLVHNVSFLKADGSLTVHHCRTPHQVPVLSHFFQFLLL